MKVLNELIILPYKKSNPVTQSPPIMPPRTTPRLGVFVFRTIPNDDNNNDQHQDEAHHHAQLDVGELHHGTLIGY